jgi:N-acetylmuramoyl-L-alanine amidase
MRVIHKIIVHCSDTDGGNAAAIRKYHMAPPPNGRGWHDIGYHFVIDQDGTPELGRHEEIIGAHCEGHNADSLGICLIGKKEFSAAQMLSLRELVISLLKKYNLTEENVFGHYEFDTAIAQGKTCPNIPGEKIRSFIKEAL